jgi:GTPase SAR1 family protein
MLAGNIERVLGMKEVLELLLENGVPLEKLEEEYIKEIPVASNFRDQIRLAILEIVKEKGLAEHKPIFSVERERECLEFLKRPSLLEDIKKELDIVIVGENQTKLTLFLLCLSKDFDPQAIYLVGQSSAGKSYLINQVLDFFPDDCVERFTRSSTHGLEYFFKDKDMNGKILVIQEALGGEEAEGALRPLISKDQKGLRIVTVDFNRQPKVIEVKGCPVYLTSTAKVNIEHQMASRVWFLSPDESEEQTSAILHFHAEAAMSLVEKKSKLRDLIKDSIRLLRPYRIVIPYAKKLAELFPKNKVKYRRDFQKLLTLIRCSAHLHQYQRKTENGILYASLQDLIHALIIAGNALKQTLMGLPELSIKILNAIKEMEDEGFERITHATIAGKMNLAEPTVRRFILPLLEEGYVTRNEEVRPYTYSSSGMHERVGKTLFSVINSPSAFFSREDFQNWFSKECYKVTSCSVCYEDINPFSEHTVPSNAITLSKQAEKLEEKPSQAELGDSSRS